MCSAYLQMEKHYGPPLRNVNACTTPLGVETVNILCSVRGRRNGWYWTMFSSFPLHMQTSYWCSTFSNGERRSIFHVKVPVFAANQTARICTSPYHGVYALDIWMSNSFPAYRVSFQMTLWHHRLAHMSDVNLQRLKKQARGVRDMEPSQPM